MSEEKAKDIIDGNGKKKPEKFLRVEGKEVKVIDSVTTMEIVIHKMEDGREVSQVIAHEFMMTDHKVYLVRLLTDAIMTVMRARKRSPMIKLASQAIFNRLKRINNASNKKSKGFGGGN